jgi:preprotein translocase subunit SecD
MTPLPALWLLAQVQAPPAESLLASLQRAEPLVERIAACAGGDPERLEETHFLLDQRRERLWMAAKDLGKGPRAKAELEVAAGKAGDCSKKGFAALRDAAVAELDRAQSEVHRALPPERRRGLWFGSLRICAARSAESGEPHGLPSLALFLDPRQADSLRRVTEERVGQPLALWLNGEAISAPNIHEPITGGALLITGRADSFGAVAAAAKAPC